MKKYPMGIVASSLVSGKVSQSLQPGVGEGCEDGVEG